MVVVDTGGRGLQWAAAQCSAETWAALPAQAALQACAPSCSRRSSAGAGSSALSTWAPPHPGWYSPALHIWLCIHARWLQAAWLCPVRGCGCPSCWRPDRLPGPAQVLSGGRLTATVPLAGQTTAGPCRPCTHVSVLPLMLGGCEDAQPAGMLRAPTPGLGCRASDVLAGLCTCDSSTLGRSVLCGGCALCNQPVRLSCVSACTEHCVQAPCPVPTRSLESAMRSERLAAAAGPAGARLKFTITWHHAAAAAVWCEKELEAEQSASRAHASMLGLAVTWRVWTGGRSRRVYSLL